MISADPSRRPTDSRAWPLPGESTDQLQGGTKPSEADAYSPPFANLPGRIAQAKETGVAMST